MTRQRGIYDVDSHGLVALECVPSVSESVDVLTEKTRKPLVGKFVKLVLFTKDVSSAAT